MNRLLKFTLSKIPLPLLVVGKYWLPLIALFYVVALFCKYIVTKSNSSLSFIFIAIISLLLGGIHIWLFHRNKHHEMMNWMYFQIPFTMLFNLLWSGVLFFHFYQLTSLKAFLGFLILASLGFSIPFMFKTTIDFFEKIPEEELPFFTIESLENAAGITAIRENSKGLVLHFYEEETKDLPDNPVRIFAPEKLGELSFELLFKAILLYYQNEVNPDQPIQINYLEEKKQCFYKWQIFYKTPFWNTYKLIDMTQTFEANKIKFNENWKGEDKNGKYRELDIAHLHIIRFK